MIQTKEKDDPLGQHLVKYAQIALAASLTAIAINVFLIPNGLLTGGVGGIAMMIHYLTGLPTGVLLFTINLPLFILGRKFVDRKFAINSFITMTLVTLMIDTTKGLAGINPLDDLLIEALFGGVLNGISMGLIFNNHASQGGMDIVAAIIKKKWNLPVSTLLMGMNAVIISLSGVIFGFNAAAYTLVALFVTYQTLARVQKGFNSGKTAMIISDHTDAIGDEIMKELKRGVTFIEGQGAYTKKGRRILYCTLTNLQIGKLHEIIDRIDPEAFITLVDLDNVRGGGFKKKEFS